MKFIFYRTSLFVLYEDIISLSTLFACIFDINNGFQNWQKTQKPSSLDI